MKKTVKKLIITFLVAVLIVGAAIPCFAEEQKGKITVTTVDKEKSKLNGVSVHLCRIAELNDTGFFPTSDFENSGLSISSIVNNPDEMAAKAVADYIKENEIEGLTTVSRDGRAVFSDLELGIWLVYCDVDGKYTFNPFLVFLPYESGGKLYFEVSSGPKIEDSKPNETNIYVFKKWDDKDNAAKKRPSEITVELLDGDSVVTSAELSEANGWSHTFYGVAKNGSYSVREKSVTDYKASYGGDSANGFVITNTYSGEKLPQTGQYWWPMVITAIVGVCFVVLGIFEIRTKKNGKTK